MRALKYIENLFNTLKKCDQNGGPTCMAFGLAGSLILNDGFDVGPTAGRMFQLVEKGMGFHKARKQFIYHYIGQWH